MEGSDGFIAKEDTSLIKEDFKDGQNEKNVALEHRKIFKIEKACQQLDLKQLAALSVLPGGFLQDGLRRKTWPLLLGSISATGETKPRTDWQALPKHRDEGQVELDVNRSFVYYPENDSESKLEGRRTRLSDIIVATLREYPMLCYFQGFHDIVQVMLLVLGDDLAYASTTRLSLLRIRDFMLPVLSPSFQHLQLLPAIITAMDKELAKHLAPARPFFALSSTLTMFAHDIEDYQMIARLFDFLLAHEASLSMYLFATIILSRRKELFEIEVEDADMLHFTLSKLPKSLDLDSLIAKAMTIFEEHPPETLPLRSWSRISTYSVLKTTRSLDASGSPTIQELDEGVKLFQKQAEQVKRQEFQKHLRIILWRHRRPISGIGLAILVGILSIWLQRNQVDFTARITSRLSSLLSFRFFRVQGT